MSSCCLSSFYHRPLRERSSSDMVALCWLECGLRQEGNPFAASTPHARLIEIKQTQHRTCRPLIHRSTKSTHLKHVLIFKDMRSNSKDVNIKPLCSDEQLPKNMKDDPNHYKIWRGCALFAEKNTTIVFTCALSLQQICSGVVRNLANAH